MNIVKRMLGLVVAVSMVSGQAAQNPVLVQLNRVKGLAQEFKTVLSTAAIAGVAHLMLKNEVLTDYSSALLVAEVAAIIGLAGATGKFVKKGIEKVDDLVTEWTPVSGAQLLGITAVAYFAHKVGGLQANQKALPSLSQVFSAPIKELGKYVASLGTKVIEGAVDLV